jgi:phage tail sheath protein FI
MPEYLAPGVYVEEVSFRSKSIEGVSTTTTAFIGPTRYGPIDIVPDVITSLVEYERTYGDRQQIVFGGSPRHNYMWHAVRQFFENGGKRVYISRVYRPGDMRPLASPPSSPPSIGPGQAISAAVAPLWVWARFPGGGGNMRVRITLSGSPNILARDGTTNRVRGVLDNDVVIIHPGATAIADRLWNAQSFFSGGTTQWRFIRASATPIDLPTLTTEQVRVITATVTLTPPDPNVPSFVYPGLALDFRHRLSGADDSLSGQFALDQPSLGRARSIPIVVSTSAFATGVDLVQHILSLRPSIGTALLTDTSSDADRSFDFELINGSDGDEPTFSEYEGIGADPTSRRKTGLKALEDIDEVSIVAAPGSTANFATRSSDALSIINLLISHATRMRYRIAVLDSGDRQTVADVRDMRGKIDSSYAAFYYPWIKIVDPVTLQEIDIPPSGAVAGIYARNDINRAVYKAPANEVVETAIGLETFLNKAQQDILNPLGVNCFRFFENRGFRLWGARTTSSDPEWKYVNLRRYFAYLEHSIDKGTQWAVFEPNGELLWANIRRTIEDFLLNEWQNGALLGDKPEKAYFVKCDRSTMTQNDLDNGRMICLVGVAALRPAEYVIIRVGQWTADRKV